jgi:hypothetical protein
MTFKNKAPCKETRIEQKLFKMYIGSFFKHHYLNKTKDLINFRTILNVFKLRCKNVSVKVLGFSY